MILKFESKIGKAGGSGPSSKTTIPKTVMELLGLDLGDKLEWTVEIIGKDKVNVSITPKKI